MSVFVQRIKYEKWKVTMGKSLTIISNQLGWIWTKWIQRNLSFFGKGMGSLGCS